MFERLGAMLQKEFKQILRDPRMRMILFVAPVLQTLVFSYAVTNDVRHAPTAVYDLDNTPASRNLVRDFAAGGYFTVKYRIDTDSELSDLLDSSKVIAVLCINRGFAADLVGGRNPQVQLILDGTDSNTAAIVAGYAAGIIQRYNAAALNLLTLQYFPQIDLRSRAWFNPDLVSRNFYVPGVIALIITLMTLLLSSMSIVREKEIGTIEQLIVSPLRPAELILGKLLPFAIIAVVEVILVASIAVLWFGIPIRGYPPLLFAATIAFITCTLGVGLFISTVSSTQQEAMMSTFLFFFPAILLSGFIFPIDNMPPLVRYITYLDPLRYYITILRAVFLKGIGLHYLWPHILALLTMGTAILTISSLRFHKRLG
jgi:ABC-2 type transport system permease protein